MLLFFTPFAEQDIEQIGDYIALENPKRAISFVAEIRKHCLKICLNPNGYRPRPELSLKMRSCPFGNYVIFFETEKLKVNVIRVLHTSRGINQQF